jgi:uncharacterized membrane protein
MFKIDFFSTFFIWGEVVILFGLYIFFNKQVKQWKEKMLQDQPELKPENPTVFADTTFRQEQLTISNKWNIVPGILLLIQLGVNIYHREFLLNHSAIMGEVAKFFAMNFVLLLGIFWKNHLIRNVKQQIQASDPEASRQRIILFRRCWSIYIYLMLTAIIAMNLIFNLQVLEITRLFDFLSYTVFSVAVGLIVLVSLVMTFFIGQGGSRIKMKSGPETRCDDVDDDQYWKAGIIYFNPDDPALWVDKRMGIGWTLNFGNKKAWVFVVVVLSIILFSALMKIFTGVTI